MRGRGLVLVTGGAGFIGSHLVDRLVSEGWRVRVLDNFSTGRMENVEHHVNSQVVEVVRGDLKDLEVVKSAVDGVDAVFHFAANPEVRVSTTNPGIHFNENVVATFNLLEAMRREGVRELVFASSSSVYGEPDEIPVGEEAPVRPVSVYGASKAACESLIHAYSKLYGIRAVILRYANVVGPRLKHGVVYDFVVKLKRSPSELEVLGDGKQVRSYVHVEDAVEATMMAWRESDNHFEVYNVASEDWITVDEVADEVMKAMGLSDVRKVYRPLLHGVGWLGDVKRVALRIDKLKALGFKPSMSSREAVRATAKKLVEELVHNGLAGRAF
ncbi:MAG: SDR family NAD(P)-dependent oxidoreductase [Candidatus Verstraetearchaeota archaeon]|nr:SDR family NAD(P)-dependent oxidoreductase [Candidatus Verstraetearchaeota archaeon]